MGSKFLVHLRRQWMGALALFLVLTGGVAYAANTVGSDDVIDNSLQSVDIKNNQLRGTDVRAESLTGADIADQSGVDTCTLGTSRFGELCVLVVDGTMSWDQARVVACPLQRGLRLPSFGEAVVLARGYDIPGLGETELFWTEEMYMNGSAELAFVASDDGGSGSELTSSARRVICVTTPTN